MHTFLSLFARHSISFPSCAFPEFSISNRKAMHPTLWIRFKNRVCSINLNSLLHRSSSNFAGQVTSASSAESGYGDDETIEILAVGAGTWSLPVHDALRSKRSLHICSTDDPRTLWLISSQPQIHVIVLDSSLPAYELEEVGRLARRRWPKAGILVIRNGENFMEDALYDDRIYPTAEPEILIACIERLAANGTKGGTLNAGR